MPKTRDNEAFLETARKRFQRCEDATSRSRREALDDLRFRIGDQWPEEIRRQREQDKRPCLTINRLQQFVRRIVNDIRQNRPSIRVNPVDSQGDPETAQIIQGLIRHIEENSSADIAYDTAADYAVTMGFGFFRIRADYTDPMSFDQEILIEPVANPFACFLDPDTQKPDRSDARYGFIIDSIPVAEFRREHPNSEAGQSGDWATLGSIAPGWFDSENVRVAEYLHIERNEIDIAKLPDGRSVPIDQVPAGTPIVSRRRTSVPQVKWALITGTEILEERDLPGRHIPLFEVVGEELVVNGERVTSGAIRDTKDQQSQYNYLSSAETEAIALAPRTPIIAAEGQLEGYELQWSQANVRNFAFLTYKPKTLGGVLVPPPQRQVFEPAIQALSMARAQAADDMKATIGIFDAALGNRSNETSGRAIRQRQIESNTATFHFGDNLARTQKLLGRVLLQWIPVYYNADMVVRIIGEDGAQKTVRVNAPPGSGVDKIYDLTTGKYDVTISVGPGFATKRQEAVESMTAFAQAVPQLVPRFADLYAKMMDWPYHEEVAARLVPPDVQQQDAKQKPIPPQVQAQIAQMDQMVQQLTQQLNQASEDLRTKRLEIESRERIAQLQEETKRVIALAQTSSAEGIELLRQEIGAIHQAIAQPQPDATEFTDQQPDAAA